MRTYNTSTYPLMHVYYLHRRRPGRLIALIGALAARRGDRAWTLIPNQEPPDGAVRLQGAARTALLVVQEPAVERGHRWESSERKWGTGDRCALAFIGTGGPVKRSRYLQPAGHPPGMRGTGGVRVGPKGARGRKIRTTRLSICGSTGAASQEPSQNPDGSTGARRQYMCRCASQ
eukprot:1105132-Pyramimonas_sp.AAC.1